MTSIAVLQCVEKGLFALDDDVSGILHEFRDAQIITGFDESGQPTFRTAGEEDHGKVCAPLPSVRRTSFLDFGKECVGEVDCLKYHARNAIVLLVI